MHEDKKKIIVHRLISCFQIIMGIAGLATVLILVRPGGRAAVTVCLAVLCVYEILMGSTNLLLTTKQSYDKLLAPCRRYLDHQRETAASRQKMLGN